jgi:hypothetical protein
VPDPARSTRRSAVSADIVRLAAALAVACAAALVAPRPARAADLAVEAGFPGGSVHVDAIDRQARTLRVQPADHPGRGWRCWWFFKVTGIEPGETLTVEVAGGGFALPARAVWSADGRTWHPTEPGTPSKGRMTYTQRIDAAEAYFAWGPPYLPEHAEALFAWAEKACPQATRFDLCRTREDRPTPALCVEPEAAGGEPPVLWIQARQHAWETGSSWAAEGLTRWLLSDEARARALRRDCRILIVPIMDVDNVVRGAGGKNQHPQDHNRDWSDRPHWHSVAAAQKMLGEVNARAPLIVFIDLHNPGPGPPDREVFLYTCPRDGLPADRRALLDAFIASARAEMNAPLGFRGQTRESGTGYDKNWKRISKNWVSQHLAGPVAAVTVEIGWNTPHSTCDGYLTVGRQLGLTLERFLREAAE